MMSLALALPLRRNLKCGTMFCVGGGESISGKRAAYNRQSMECKLAVDDDRSRSLDMVPRGTRCGANKVRSPREQSDLGGLLLLVLEGCFRLLAFCLTFKRVCSGVPGPALCGRVGVRPEGGV